MICSLVKWCRNTHRNICDILPRNSTFCTYKFSNNSEEKKTIKSTHVVYRSLNFIDQDVTIFFRFWARSRNWVRKSRLREDTYQ